MNNIIAGAIGFVAGSAIGGGIAYAILKGKMEKHYAELEDHLHQIYDIKMDRIDASAKYKDTVDILCDPVFEDEEAQKEYYMDKLKSLGYTTYEVDDDEVNPVDNDDFFEDDEAPVESLTGIELLSYNEFVRIDDTNLKHINLTYYAGDKTITDDTDEIIPEWRELVGEEWLDEVNEINHTCFVVNHDAGILADIEYMEGSYKQLVEGVASDEE